VFLHVVYQAARWAVLADVLADVVQEFSPAACTYDVVWVQVRLLPLKYNREYVLKMQTRICSRIPDVESVVILVGDWPCDGCGLGAFAVAAQDFAEAERRNYS
jgi:hypothetical protein